MAAKRPDPFARAFVELLRKQPKRKKPLKKLLSLIDAETPADAAAFLRARAEHTLPEVSLGWRALRDETATAGEIMKQLEMEPSVAKWLKPDRSLLLGTSGGGELSFAAHWSRGQLEFITIEHEWDLYADLKPIVDHGNATRFWKAILRDEKERAQDGDEELEPFLYDLFAAAGAPLKAPKKKPKPPAGHLERALIGYPRNAEVLSRGKRQVVHARGQKDANTRVVICDAAFTVLSKVKWPAGVPVRGVSYHPTDERALLSTAYAGPLYELDLKTGRPVKIHDMVGWTCGYVDKDHVVTFSDGTLAIYRHRTGKPLENPEKTLACGGSSLFVHKDLCFVTGFKGGVEIYRGAGLEHRGSYPLHPPRHAGALLDISLVAVDKGVTFLKGHEENNEAYGEVWYKLGE